MKNRTGPPIARRRLLTQTQTQSGRRGERAQPGGKRALQSDHQMGGGSIVSNLTAESEDSEESPSRMGRASRGRGPTPAKPLTQIGRYPTGRALAAPLWVGRPLSTLTSTGQSGHRGCTKGSRHTWSGLVETSNRG